MTPSKIGTELMGVDNFDREPEFEGSLTCFKSKVGSEGIRLMRQVFFFPMMTLIVSAITSWSHSGQSWCPR